MQISSLLSVFQYNFSSLIPWSVADYLQELVFPPYIQPLWTPASLTEDPKNLPSLMHLCQLQITKSLVFLGTPKVMPSWYCCREFSFLYMSPIITPPVSSPTYRFLFPHSTSTQETRSNLGMNSAVLFPMDSPRTPFPPVPWYSFLSSTSNTQKYFLTAASSDLTWQGLI